MNIDTPRAGLSFTLTLVVVGVILLMTALTVITLGGASLSDFFGAIGEQSTQAKISSACGDLGEDVQNTYCGQPVDSSCAIDSTSSETADDRGCGWPGQTDANGNTLDATVTVEGADYNCLDQNELTQSCTPGEIP